MTTVTTPAAGRGMIGSVPLRKPWNRSRVTLLLVAIGGAVGSIWGLSQVDLSIFAIIEGWPETQSLLERMWPPTIAAEDRGFLTGLVFDTFFMAYAGTAIGVFLAVPLAFLAASNIMPIAPVRFAARGIIVFTRAVPTIVFALVFVRVYGIGVLPGILAIGIHSVGMIAKLLADALEDIDPGPRDGVVATGAGRFQEMITGVWSQIIPRVISISLYRLEIDFRGAPILGFVGAGGIGLAIRGYQGNLRYPELLGVTLLIVVLVVLMEMLSAITRRAVLGSELGDATMGRSKSKAAVLGVDDRGSVIATPIAARSVNSGTSGLTAPWTRDRLKLNLAGWGALALLVGSFTVPDVSIREFFSSIGGMPGIFWRLVPKDMTWLSDAVVADLIETIAIGFAATFLALIFAVPLSFFAAANTAPSRIVYRFTRMLALLIRAAPDLVIAVILVAAIGLGPAAGTIALAFGMIGFATKLLADNIEEVPEAPREGVFATGATRVQEVGTGVAPQVLPAMLGNMLYLFDVSLRSSTVLGIVGAGGIGFLLNNAAKTLRFEVMGGIILSVFVIVYAIELLSTWVRRQVI